MVAAQASPAGPAPTTMTSGDPLTCLATPHLRGHLDRKTKLGPLLVLGEDIALLGRGKSALRRERELIERRKFRGFGKPPLDVVLALERSAFGGDEADHHDLVALGQVTQRLEATGALGIIFKEIAVVIGASEQRFGDRLVTAG